ASAGIELYPDYLFTQRVQAGSDERAKLAESILSAAGWGNCSVRLVRDDRLLPPHRSAGQPAICPDAEPHRVFSSRLCSVWRASSRSRDSRVEVTTAT